MPSGKTYKTPQALAQPSKRVCWESPIAQARICNGFVGGLRSIASWRACSARSKVGQPGI